MTHLAGVVARSAYAVFLLLCKLLNKSTIILALVHSFQNVEENLKRPIRDIIVDSDWRIP